MSYFDDHEEDIIYGRRGTPHRDSLDGRLADRVDHYIPPPTPALPPNGFREFSQQKAPVNVYHLELVRSAKIYVADEWEHEFYESIKARVMDSGPLSTKQLDLLQRMATGKLAEERRRREDARDGGDQRHLSKDESDVPF